MPIARVRGDDDDQPLPLDPSDRGDQHRRIDTLRVDREADEVEPGVTQIRQCLVAEVVGQDGGIPAGGEAEPAGDVDAASQDDLGRAGGDR